MTLKKKSMCVCVWEARLARRSEKFGVKSWRGWLCVPLPSSSSCRFARSLKSFQPTNRASFHASARIHIHGKKCFADHESFRWWWWWWWLEKNGGGKKKWRHQGWEWGRITRATIENLALCAFSPAIDGRTVIVTPFSKIFQHFFRARYAIRTCWSLYVQKFPWFVFSLSFFLFFFFRILDLDGLLRCFFQKDIVAITFHFDFEDWRVLEKCCNNSFDVLICCYLQFVIH